MEVLFILIVLYLIFSAVTKGLRAAAEQTKSTQLPPQQHDSKHELVLETIRSSAEPASVPRWPEYLYPDEPLLQQERPVDKKPDVPNQGMKPPTVEQQSRKGELPRTRSARSQQREVSRGIRKNVSKQTAVSTLGLEQLIRGNNIRQAVVAAEVLSAPRSKKPFSQRHR